MVPDALGSSILSEVALFQGLTAEQLSDIEARLGRKTFLAGDNVITAEGLDGSTTTQERVLGDPCPSW